MLVTSSRWLPQDMKQVWSRPLSIFLCLMASMVFFGCGGKTNINYVSGAPPEKLCTLNIKANLFVTEFNGEKVDWSAGGFLDDYEWASVQIPEGGHTFTVHYSQNRSGGFVGTGARMRMVTEVENSGNMSVSYDNFIAGHTYRMIYSKYSRSVKIKIEDVTNTNIPDGPGK